jgi:hypothetical protein
MFRKTFLRPNQSIQKSELTQAFPCDIHAYNFRMQAIQIHVHNFRPVSFITPRGTLYPQQLPLTLPTSGGRSVGIVRPRNFVFQSHMPTFKVMLAFHSLPHFCVFSDSFVSKSDILWHSITWLSPIIPHGPVVVWIVCCP